MAVRALDEIAHDLLAEAGALMARQDGDVADIRTVETISQRSTGGDQATIFVYEALEHAVGEDRLEMQRLLVTQRSYPIERRELSHRLRQWSTSIRAARVPLLDA